MSRTLTRWTLADYHRMIESGLLAGRQVELIEGQIINMAPEQPIHRATYRRGIKYLESVLGTRAVIFATAPITLDNNSEPQPDIAVLVAPESRYDDRHPTPTDIYWLIEVSNSTLAYDLADKARLYASNAIVEYWVFDVLHRGIWVHRQPQDGIYRFVASHTTGSLSPLAFPGISLDLDRFLC
jgi:Uma2 family endonuclease